MFSLSKPLVFILDKTSRLVCWFFMYLYGILNGACLRSNVVDSFATYFLLVGFHFRQLQLIMSDWCYDCRTMRLATFPDYLFLHMQKFTVGNDWVERKLGRSLFLCSNALLLISRLTGFVENELIKSLLKCCIGCTTVVAIKCSPTVSLK